MPSRLIIFLLLATSSASTQPDAPPSNRFLNVVTHFKEDLGSLNRFYHIQQSETRCLRLLEFYANWTSGIDNWSDRNLSQAESETAERFHQRLHDDTQQLLRDLHVARQLRKQHPFTVQLIELLEARQRVDPIEPREVAGTVSEISSLLAEAVASLKEQPPRELTVLETRTALKELRSHFNDWFKFYDGYHPEFSWWLKAPFDECDEQLDVINEVLKDQPKAARNAKPVELPPNLPNPVEADQPVNIRKLLGDSNQRLPALIEEYAKAKAALRQRPRKRNSGETVPRSPKPLFEEFYKNWQSKLQALDFDKLSRSDQVDYLLLKNDIDYQQAKLDLPERSRTPAPPPMSLEGMPAFPVGEKALQVELDHEMIRYSPEELVEIAEQELQWCRRELIKASQEMGFEDDWRAAVEKVKTMHVEPGEQPAVIKDLAIEAIEYLKTNDRLTVPPIAEETWRMTMLSPRQQLISPFFLGGEVIQVSFPTDTMKHDDKLQSMRGNNIPFARATVHHELIPGHHLQTFSRKRHRTYRRSFGTPFWMEGWALYWEMMLYDAGFPKTPEDRVGFLVWRSHRCARIVFSLNFHLGRMTPPECIDLLVDWVGFDRNNAAAEVRRSVGRGYSPLYQAAYMLGGLQIRQLRKEVVDTGKMTEKQFHDAILKENSIPISLLRAILTDAPLSRDQEFQWRFYDEESVTD